MNLDIETLKWVLQQADKLQNKIWDLREVIFKEIEKGNLDNQKIVFIHTGGIQGAKAIQEKEGIKLYV